MNRVTENDVIIAIQLKDTGKQKIKEFARAHNFPYQTLRRKVVAYRKANNIPQAPHWAEEKYPEKALEGWDTLTDRIRKSIPIEVLRNIKIVGKEQSRD